MPVAVNAIAHRCSGTRYYPDFHAEAIILKHTTSSYSGNRDFSLMLHPIKIHSLAAKFFLPDPHISFDEFHVAKHGLCDETF
mmetsp:Transcript_33238/g.33722  ORF Transcript_33238/g.33722 Transcript_33238/m.33722 type:complete len:82 (-) Transcript_33238:28-273(-)